MQTWITFKEFSESAQMLDRRRLGANIYESIHILASLQNVSDKLVTPKRNVSNHPASKLWKGYEGNLACYILCHIQEWESRGYKCPTNRENLNRIAMNLSPFSPDWITDEVIQTHRSVLIQKNPDHYRPLWPDCPDDLEMAYDWRSL